MNYGVILEQVVLNWGRRNGSHAASHLKFIKYTFTIDFETQRLSAGALNYVARDLKIKGHYSAYTVNSIYLLSICPIGCLVDQMSAFIICTVTISVTFSLRTFHIVLLYTKQRIDQFQMNFILASFLVKFKSLLWE